MLIEAQRPGFFGEIKVEMEEEWILASSGVTEKLCRNKKVEGLRDTAGGANVLHERGKFPRVSGKGEQGSS